MIKVLGINLYDKDLPAAVQTVVASVTGEDISATRCISATGAHGIIEAHKDAQFKAILNAFYLNLPDGVPCVWVGRLKGSRDMQRCYGPDFFKETICSTAGTRVKHFFCGGKAGVADELRLVCGERFGNDQVAGTFSPPFRQMTDTEMQALGQQIEASGAHIVWIGLSTPKQEAFAHRLAGYLKGHYIVTVGAAFDFHTGKVKQAPGWMQRMGLEWLFRLLVEPRRLYRRYFEIVPQFIWLNIKEFIDFYIRKKKYI